MTVRTAFQILAWLCLTTIGALSLVAPSLRPVTILPHSLEHAAIFAATGFAAGLGYPGRPALAMTGLVTFAAMVELAQFFAPGRHPRLIDFAVDALAACAGVMVALAIARLRAAKS